MGLIVFFWIMVMALLWGPSFLFIKVAVQEIPPLVGPTAQLTMAAVYLIPLSLLVEQPFNGPLPSWSALGALIALVGLGTALAYVVYYRTMELTSASNLSMVTYMVPLVGTVLGVLVLREQLGWPASLGCGLIIWGVMMVNGIFRTVGWRRRLGLTIRPQIATRS